MEKELKKYILLNNLHNLFYTTYLTEQSAQAKNKFEKQFYNLLKNAFYGKQ